MCLCKAFSTDVCMPMHACVRAVRACVCVDRARRWRVMANFEAATATRQRCLSSIHLCV